MILEMVSLALLFPSDAETAYPRPELLVEPAALSKKLDQFIVLDASKKSDYEKGHVPGAVPVERLVEQGLTRVPGASIVAVVTGGLAQADALRTADLAIPLDAYAVALRCGSDLDPARRKVGRLNVLDLSGLDELPRAMRTLR